MSRPIPVWLRVLSPLLLSLGLVGCQTECEAAACLIEERCRLTVEGIDGGQCDPEMEAFAVCANRHEFSVCAYLQDPVANADNAFGRCLNE